MKKLLLLSGVAFLLFSLCLNTTFANESDEIVRLKCSGDMVKRTKNNMVAGTIFTFTLKDGKLYGREGELVKNAEITNEEIKAKLKYKHGLSWENTRIQINRYTGAFNYHSIYRTLESYKEIRNSGMCEKVANEQKF